MEKTPPLEIHNKVQEEFVVVLKKRPQKTWRPSSQTSFETREDSQAFCFVKIINQEKSQHNGIGSHLFYLNLQHCNVSLSFNKIKLVIVKHLQNIGLIFNVQVTHFSSCETCFEILCFFFVLEIPKVTHSQLLEGFKNESK